MSGRVYGVLVLGLVLGCGLAWRAGAQPGGASSASENAERAVRVELHDGALVGVLRDRVEVFEGIPYAAAPVGALRWALPQPAPGWSGDRDARSFGPSCMQDEAPRNVPPGSPEARTSEDCLTLNVWAPQRAGKAPVMVWLHGGGNTQGSSADHFYDGTGFARDGVVLVSLNYRLGIFGFLPYGGDANFGLWDQIAALRWVKANIAAFGGDPDNVTLFGESAGGQDALALLTATAARGLFGKAVVESAGGGWGPPATLVQAQAAADSLLGALRSSLHGSAPPDLRTVPADAVQKAAAEGDWGPVVDGHLLSEAPLEAFADGHAARIPLVIGTNSEEGSLLGPNPRPAAVFANLPPEDLTRVQSLYGSAAPGGAELAEVMFRDGYFAGPAQWVAAQVARSGGQAYLYRFEYVMSLLQRRRTGAHHGSEIPFVFDSWPDPERLAPADRLVGRALHGCWASFARTGSPTCAEAPGWAAFGADRQWMVFDTQPSLRPIAGEPAIALLSSRLAPAALRVDR